MKTQKWLRISLHIHGHPWNAWAENTHQHGMGGARVCRGCAGPYLRKRLNSQKKSQKNCKKLKSNIVLLHLPLNSNIFTKAQCVCKGALEFSHESVRVNFRRSTDKCDNITRITYNNNKNCKSTFVCYISNAIPGFTWKLNVFAKARYELSRESVCVYLRRSKDKRDNITRIICNKSKQTEIQHFLLYLPLNSRICMKNQCFYKSALRIQPRRRLRLLEDVEGYKRRHYKNHRQKQQRKLKINNCF